MVKKLLVVLARESFKLKTRSESVVLQNQQRIQSSPSASYS